MVTDDTRRNNPLLFVSLGLASVTIDIENVSAESAEFFNDCRYDHTRSTSGKTTVKFTLIK